MYEVAGTANMPRISSLLAVVKVPNARLPAIHLNSTDGVPAVRSSSSEIRVTAAGNPPLSGRPHGMHASAHIRLGPYSTDGGGWESFSASTCISSSASINSASGICDQRRSCSRRAPSHVVRFQSMPSSSRLSFGIVVLACSQLFDIRPILQIADASRFERRGKCFKAGEFHVLSDLVSAELAEC